MSGPPRLPNEVPADQGATLETEADRVTAASSLDSPEVLPLLEEALQVSKRQIVAGTVRVSTHTETYDEVAQVTLDRSVIDITRVPVGRLVDEAPSVRTDGDTTIVPVIEERFVVVKQLYLKEELHVRRRVEQDVSQIPVQLRRQTALVERLDASGEPFDETSTSS